MATPRYLWRQLNEKQREELLEWRKQRGYPWHSPPHWPNFEHLRFLISAACFEHHHYIGHSPERMDHFSRDLLAVFAAYAGETTQRIRHSLSSASAAADALQIRVYSCPFVVVSLDSAPRAD